MRIVFMGTPDFAAKSLERLYDDGCDVVGVFTQPDRPRNRGMKVSQSPVKELAISHGTPVFQPSSLKNDEAVGLLRGLECDLLVVVAYGKLLPKEFFDIPPLGAVNIHASLLPKYRGAAPIQWAIMNGETKTGVTSMYIAEELDSGDMILIKETEIGDDETAGELYDRLSVLGAQVLSDTVGAISAGTANRIAQDHNLATYAPLITKELSPIDWTQTAHNIKCKVRGLAPKPGATAMIDGLNMKVYEVEIFSIPNVVYSIPGEIISKGKHGIEITCADGSVLIKELQPPGGKRMNAADFVRGRKI